MIVEAGSTSLSVIIEITDDAGLGVSGLVASTFPTVKYDLAGSTAATITLSDLGAANSAYSSGGVKEVATGACRYRLDLPNAAIAAAGKLQIFGDDTDKHVLVAPIDVVSTLPADVRKILGTTSAGAAGYVGLDWSQVTNKTASNAFTGTTIATTQKVDLETIKTNAVVNGGTITFPTNSTLASSSEVTAIQNNTRVVRVVPNVIEDPDTGTQTYRIELYLYDDAGNMEAPDSAPTVALVNQAGTDRSSRLDSTTMTLVETGRYRSIYTATAGNTLEQLLWTFSVVEGGATRKYGNTSIVGVDMSSTFTAADRVTLQQLPVITDILVTPGQPIATDVTGGVTVASLSTSAIASIWNRLTSAITTAGSIGKWILDKLDVAVSTVSGGVGGGGSGDGDTPVDHDTGGADSYQILSSASGHPPLDNATLKAFLKSDYDAGRRTDAYVQAVQFTGANGRWVGPMMLDAGTEYTIVVYDQGFVSSTFNVTPA
jgi:hypothetical protein